MFVCEISQTSLIFIVYLKFFFFVIYMCTYCKHRHAKHARVIFCDRSICDPPYDFGDKGDSTLPTRFHLKTIETDYNTLAEHTRAHINELMLLFHVTHLKQYTVRR